MDLIINDFSIDGQFDSFEDFLDSLSENTLPMLDIIKNNAEVYKTYNTYNCRLFDDMTINDFIHSNNYNSYPEITVLKKLLHSFTDNPYWEDNIKTDSSASYFCELLGRFSGNSPNCFSETLERDGSLISFEHNKFKDSNIHIKKNDNNHYVHNGYNKESLGKYLFLKGIIGFSEYMMSWKYPRKIEFYKHKGRYYADEPFENGELNQSDVFSIHKDFVKSLDFIIKGSMDSRFSDSINHKNYTYYEFRCSLSSKREFRIYYYTDKGKLVYFNSLIKKTTTLSDEIKDKTVDLIKAYLNK